MSYTVYTLLAFSIVLPAGIAAARFRKADAQYLPFLVLTWVGLLNETISYVVLDNGDMNIMNENLYNLAESLLILWQFLRWGLFQKSKWQYRGMQVLFIGLWVVENFVIAGIQQVSTYFIAGCSFCVVMMSIHTITEVVVFEPRQLLKNPKFLICIGFIIYFTYCILTEVFWMFGLHQSLPFRVHVSTILIFINTFCNLIYAFSILWMPTKFRYILPSSSPASC